MAHVNFAYLTPDGLSQRCLTPAMKDLINDFLGPLFGRQVEALIMAFHQHGEAAGGTTTVRWTPKFGQVAKRESRS